VAVAVVFSVAREERFQYSLPVQVNSTATVDTQVRTPLRLVPRSPQTETLLLVLSLSLGLTRYLPP
jgi:hypothetical protein